MNKANCIILLFVFLFSISCAHHYQVKNQERLNLKDEKEILDIFLKRFPPEITLKQHIILTIFHKQFDFVGYLVINENSQYRVLGFTDMGSKVFDLLYNNGSLEIIQNVLNIPEKPLRKGVMEEIVHIYYSFLESCPEIYSLANGEFLIFKEKDREKEYFYLNENLLVYTSYIIKRGRNKTIVLYSDYRQVNGLTCLIPYSIELKNLRWHYTLEIDLLSIQPEIKEHDVFITE